ncbi:hypothetical protein AA0229_1226 [Gluconobacter cerinus NRIC 0229]|nr:hypothetical protein AA0229_1226 [Gluconobacter cerinus NRIC 0229]
MDPRRYAARLNIGDHYRLFVRRAVKACFEALHTTGAAVRHAKIFALVPIFTLRRRETFAFDGKKRIEIVMPPTFDPDDFSRWGRDQIDPPR